MKFGVDTFGQGTFVQGQLCPRDISPRRLLPKETLVQGDFCLRCKFEKSMAVHIIFRSESSSRTCSCEEKIMEWKILE